MKPGVATSEFAVVAGAVASILGGVVSAPHSQIIVGVLAAAYTLARTILKAVTTWQGGGQ